MNLQALGIPDIVLANAHGTEDDAVKETKTKNERKGKLPAGLKPFFWDYDFRRLTWEEDRELIIFRLLSHGDWEALKWLHGRLKKEGLREWILLRKGRGLSPRQLRFWELILDLPHNEVGNWLKEKRREVWEGRTG